MKNQKEIEKIYKLYGLEKAEETCNDIVFTYSVGYFNNAEILILNKDKSNSKEFTKTYEELGFAVRCIEFNDIKTTHKHLFEGFFLVNTIKKRLLKEYNYFLKLQKKKLLGIDYKYIEPSYILNGKKRIDKLTNIINKNLFDNTKSQLIIIEAAAGYGKTCSSYEVIKEISNLEKKIAPMFIELSKNRKATLFRYVLLDEIDHNFSTMSSKLVRYEIKKGNVPLVIDGFDELISRSNNEFEDQKSDEDENAQTMLDTIAELFDKHSKTKVILTSRKSSIFTGEIFKNWVKDKLKYSNITRIEISDPSIKEWIGYKKIEILKKNNIPMKSISNPILLAFLKNLTYEEFVEKCENIENVTKNYFKLLLEREKERQSLLLSVDEQYNIMRKLVVKFLEYDISSEEPSFIRELLMEINKDNFNQYREKYLNIEEKPSAEEFAIKLSGHVLLDRISPNKNEIGFINDFVFGIFIKDIIIKKLIDIDLISEGHLDIMISTVSVFKEKDKHIIYKSIQSKIEKMMPEKQLLIGIKLADKIFRDYSNIYFRAISFEEKISFDGIFKFNNCIFDDCIFNKCIIFTSSFNNCKFYNCTFYEVDIKLDTMNSCQLIFENCIGNEDFEKEASYETKKNIDSQKYEKYILAQFWKPGKFSKGKLHQQNLSKGLNHNEMNKFKQALENLIKENIISKEGQFWELNMDKINRIKSKLGK